jgi:heterodisulfide reductase subunit A
MAAKNKRRTGAALVVGAGVGGMQAALDLADAGIKAYLLDGKGSIGGRMVQLDKTFPTNDCAMCTIAPRLVTIDRHLNIELLVNSELIGISGKPGDFKVKIRRNARYVDEAKCTACGTCEEKCPAKVDSEFNGSLAKRKAIFTLFPQAVPNIPVVDKEHCIYFIKGKCRACEIVCEPKAIDLDREDEIIEVNVGAVILSPGYDLFNAAEKPQLGFGRYPNVLSSLQFERMLAASGPFAGDVMRMSDKKAPHKLAFIQCIGSREKEADFCSAVCCMYATKEAIIMKEHHPEMEIAIYFIDIRAYGKGFESYYERAKRLGVRYVRCQPSSIKEVPDTKDLIIRYQREDGQMVDETYNMVVLSCGMRPSEGAREITEQFGVDVDEYGWCKTDLFAPVATSREGIYAAGAYTGPKDIPETVMQASSAASNVLGLLNEEKGTLLKEKTYPEEKATTGQEPRIGVFVCHCGKNIANVVDIEKTVEHARALPGVVHVENAIFACSTDAGERIKQVINEHDLNRIVIAACTPRTHEPLFQDTLQEAGLNPYLMVMANIRNQCAWVHMEQPELATQKAKELIKIATIKAKHLEPLYPEFVDINHDALVVGGGIAGMTAAIELADQGFKTHLLEKGDRLGGNMWRIRFLPGGNDPIKKLDEMIDRVEKHPLIEIYKKATIEDFEGSAGNFKTSIKSAGKNLSIDHGAVIVATGGTEYKPTEYLYGQDERVITQLELEDKLAGDEFDAKSVVMIQCVGSRDEKHPYCSRLCCNQAVKNAILIKEKNPASSVFVLYRDIRTYSLNESEYTRARDLGVIFIRFEDAQNPEVSRTDKRFKVSVQDQMLDARLNIPADMVVLSAGVIPHESNNQLAKMLKVPVTEDGFFQEAHIKLRPVDFSNDGIFLCGLAHSPKSVEESITQASAAAARASAILSKSRIQLEACISEVLDANCDGCAYCVDPCPFNAITLIEYRKGDDIKKSVEADPAKCHGCGVCMATCPKKGIMVRNFQLEQISEMVDATIGLV